jgi:AraC family transcriptional regulator
MDRGERVDLEGVDALSTAANRAVSLPGARPAAIPAGEWASLMPRPPVLTSRDTGWRDITGCRFQHPWHSGVEAPPLDAHLIVCHLANPSGIALRINGRWMVGESHPGEVMILSANQANEWRWDQAPDVLHLYLPTALLQQAAVETGCEGCELIDGFGRSDPVIFRIGSDLLLEMSSHGLGCRLYGDALAQLLAVQLLRTHTRLRRVRNPGDPVLPKAKLRRVIEYVEAHLGESLTVKQIAGLAGVSTFHFARAFKNSAGLPVHQYVLRRRVERACRLLGRPELTIAEIALSVGFANQNHFTTCFGRILGTTPKKYRDCVRG